MLYLAPTDCGEDDEVNDDNDDRITVTFSIALSIRTDHVKHKPSMQQ